MLMWLVKNYTKMFSTEDASFSEVCVQSEAKPEKV